MPKIMGSTDVDIINVTGPGTFQFSAMRIEDLGATEYTLVNVVCDISGSVSQFAGDLLECIKSIIDACQKSPRAENLLLRLLLFNRTIVENHGFLNLVDIDPNTYDPLHPNGTTALFDATYDAVGATTEYSKRLIDQDFDCNGITFVITDGMDNESTMTPKSIKDKLQDCLSKEEIESYQIVLIQVNDPTSSYNKEVTAALKMFCTEAGITQFVDIGSATAKQLAKLAQFVSQSISSQSQALGTGAPSQSLTF